MSSPLYLSWMHKFNPELYVQKKHFILGGRRSLSMLIHKDQRIVQYILFLYEKDENRVKLAIREYI